MLAHHDPFPAVVMDRGWDLLRANDGANRLFGRLLAPEPVPRRANVLRLIIEPGPVHDALRNWTTVVPALVDRARREAVGGVLDPDTTQLIANLRQRPDVTEVVAAPDTSTPTAPVIDLRFLVDGDELAFFSVVSTIGTPIDITAQELRIETFFPANDTTRTRWPGQGSR